MFKKLSACMLLVAVGAAKGATVMSFFGAVQFSGAIEQGDAARLSATFEKFDSPPPLFIVSQGGSLEAALQLVPIIRSRASKVYASGLCVSACASVVLASHPVREARKTAIVAFHATDSSWLLESLAEMKSIASVDQRFAELFGELMRRSEADVLGLEQKLKTAMTDGGLAFDMFARASHFTRKRLKHLKYNLDSYELDINQERATNCSYWVPDEAELAKMGLNFRGGYKRLPLSDLAEKLKVPPGQILLRLEDGEIQCQDLPKG